MGWFEDILSDGDVIASILGSAVEGVGGIFGANAQQNINRDSLQLEREKLSQEARLAKERNLAALLQSIVAATPKPVQRTPFSDADHMQTRLKVADRNLQAKDSAVKNFIAALR